MGFFYRLRIDGRPEGILTLKKQRTLRTGQVRFEIFTGYEVSATS